MTKELSELAWDISEEEYRADPALSYSILARYEREGFNNISKLTEKTETPSLTFGSAVDALMTGGTEEFESRFMTAEFPAVPDSVIKMVKTLFKKYHSRSLKDIPDKDIICETEIQGYQLNWRPETRAKVIKEKGENYYDLLFIAGDKTILDTETYNDVMNTVDALKNSESTRFYFADDNPFDDIKRYYQLKFKAVFDGIAYRCMAD